MTRPPLVNTFSLQQFTHKFPYPTYSSTCSTDHLYIKATSIVQRLHFSDPHEYMLSNEPVNKDHLHRRTIFCCMGSRVVSKCSSRYSLALTVWPLWPYVTSGSATEAAPHYTWGRFYLLGLDYWLCSPVAPFNVFHLRSAINRTSHTFVVST